MKIKIKELMLGDLVMVDNKPCKVLELGGMACVTPIDKYDELFCNEEDMEPITITKEILEKNGFSSYAKDNLRYECEVDVLTPERCEVCVTLQDESPDYDEDSANIDVYAGPDGDFYGRPWCAVYVHQLQQILRICGIEKEIVL